MKRNFVYLGIVTLLVLFFLFVYSPTGQVSKRNGSNELLLPEISEKINSVNRVSVYSAGHEEIATLLRVEDSWVMEQFSGYRADWPKVQSLLAALARARVLEAKTDNPSYYPRLGVEDIDAQGAGSVLILLGIDEQSTGLIIGHRAEGRTGQYVRLQESLPSALIDQEIDLPTTSLDWLDSRIIDFSASEVAEVEVIHADNERVFISRISADQTDFDLVGIPPGREFKSSWAVNSLASVLSMLDLQTVRRDEGVDWSPAARMRLLMFSGLEVMADVMELNEEYLFRFQVTHPEAKIVTDNAAVSEHQQVSKQVDMGEMAQQVNSINRKSSGWVYGISKQKHDTMVKRLDDILKPPDQS